MVILVKGTSPLPRVSDDGSYTFLAMAAVISGKVRRADDHHNPHLIRELADQQWEEIP